jgi:hypothetical protein
LENKYIYEKIDRVLQNQDKVDYEELLELFKMLELNMETSKTNINNKLDENSFYTYIKSSYYVKKLETIYSSFVVTTAKNEDER